MITDRTNGVPDVSLDLTHEQATFMLENCLANQRLCFAMVISLADENIPHEKKREKAEEIENMRNKFAEISKLLRRAGAKEKEEGEDK